MSESAADEPQPPVVHRGSRAGAYALVPVGGLLAIGIIALISVLVPQPVEPGRGAAGSLELEATLGDTSLRASWTAVAGAEAYELRVYDASGRLVRASQVEPQTLAVDIDVMELGGATSVTALDVVARDGAGQTLLQSVRVDLLR